MNVLPQIETQAPAPSLDDWYKDAIIYQLHVKAFFDSNDDGIGDFAGLTTRLDYLQDLGVTALWLLPFYPSPGRDDGYDIADYRRINPDFGTLKDFRRFMAEAKRRNLRVITELVINHTSDQHPWFKRARRSKPWTDARNWYVWSDTDQKYLGTRIIFTDTEKSNWTWDPEAGAYYWHRFFSHQPDLNYDNPRVLWAVVQVMRRWLDMGVDGFRLDAIPYLCEREGTNNENLPETHAIIKKIRAELDSYAPGKLLLAEANQWPEDVSAYFGDGDECQMAYHFPLMPRIYMAIAQEDRFPIADILRQTPDIPQNCQWALFLRNHDELTLEMVTDSERDYLWSTYAADPRARLNLGIRRRLAPLMDNDRRKIELMNSLLMSLPGTPILYYGDEIGMGDNIYLGDRNGVRTPMQWTPDRNAGFSRCDPAKLYAPVIMDPVYGYQAVNVEAQSRSISSLLSWMKRLIAVRKSSPVFGRGTLSFIRPKNRAVLAYLRQYGSETILCVANLSRSAQAAELDLSPWRGRVPVEMLGRTRFPRIGDAPFVVTMAPYGFFWFQLIEEAGGEPEPLSIVPELPTLVIRDVPDSVVEERSRAAFEREALPAFLPARRWFAEKDSRRFEAKLDAVIPLEGRMRGIAWTLVDVTTERGAGSRYALPLMIRWGKTPPTAGQPAVLASVRRGGSEGLLIDAPAERDFMLSMMSKLHAGATVEAGGGRLQFKPSRGFADGPPPAVEEVRAITGEQSNTTVIVDGAYVVKVFRRLQAGINPDIEISRFLTETAGYQNTPPFIGSVEFERGGEVSALSIVQGFVGNQGDGWALTSSYLDRFLDDYRLLAPDAVADPAQHAAFLLRMRQIGRRVGEMHTALASGPPESDFTPEPLVPEDFHRWTEDLSALAERTFQSLARAQASLPDPVRPLAAELAGRRDTVLARIYEFLRPEPTGNKIRYHGDLHLGQLLIVKDDVFIIDFEGEPQRSLEERRRKAPAARDVAGLIRSIDYAGTAALDRIIPSSSEERARLAGAVDEWRTQCVEALLAAHEEHAAEGLWPADPGARRRLLDFFVLQKAVYEISYELSNRPNWLHVPVLGLWRILFPDESTPV
ncbi:MAG TPA: maltose alpha-D-glucosyltransferase [Xanthobacteraceae bacterium]|nr:maltose alpha-D-glucosyltransferase [Xanthobacteraceae bacterium]